MFLFYFYFGVCDDSQNYSDVFSHLAACVCVCVVVVVWVGRGEEVMKSTRMAGFALVIHLFLQKSRPKIRRLEASGT